MVRRVTSKTKWKSKVWYEVLAPPEFGEVAVGETPASDPGLLKGRTVEVPANNLTGRGRQSHVKLKLQIENVAGKTVKTKITELSLSRSYLRSIVRRMRSKVELVKDFTTKDEKKVRLKIVAITARKAHTSQEKLIRKKIKEKAEELVKGKELKDLLNDILNYSFQQAIRDDVQKTYPTANLEVRKVEIL